MLWCIFNLIVAGCTITQERQEQKQQERRRRRRGGGGGGGAAGAGERRHRRAGPSGKRYMLPHVISECCTSEVYTKSILYVLYLPSCPVALYASTCVHQCCVCTMSVLHTLVFLVLCICIDTTLIHLYMYEHISWRRQRCCPPASADTVELVRAVSGICFYMYIRMLYIHS
jgi:hypothetical protein